MRRLAGMVVVLVAVVGLAACTETAPSPPITLVTTGPTTAPTTAPTTGPTTGPTTAATTGATTAPTTGSTTDPLQAACQAIDDLQAALTGIVPDFDQVAQLGNQLVEISGTISDQGQAQLVGLIGQDAVDLAQALDDGDFEKASRLQNELLDTIPPARVGLGCS